MAAKRISQLDPVSAANVDNGDSLVLFDAGADETKRVLRSNLLANNSGASVVGYTQGGASAVDRTVQNKLRETVSVKDFGAVGDGATDDTAAIQAAIDYAELVNDGNAQTGGVVYFPPGAYNITSALVIDNGFVTLHSERRSASISSSAAINLLEITGTLSETVQWNTIKGLRFSGSSTTAFIKTAFTEYLRVEDCVFAGGANAIEMSTTASQFDIKPIIQNNTFFQNAYGILTGETRVADITIHQNIFQEVSNTAIRGGYFDGAQITFNKIFSDPSVVATENNGIILFKPIYNKVIGNDIFECKGYGLRVGSARSCSFSQNTIIKTGATNKKEAVSFYEYNPAVSSIGNTFIDNKIDRPYGHGLSLTTVGGMEIVFNQIFTCGFDQVSKVYDSIRMINSDANKVRYNEIDGGSQARYYLYLDSSLDIVVEDNAVSNHVNADIFRVNNPSVRFMAENKLLEVSTTTTLSYADDGAIVDASGGAVTINLPASTSMNAGHEIYIAKIDSSANAVTVDAASSLTINGATTYTLSNQFDSVTLISDGNNNFVIKSST